jgi:hypothetical protein
VLLAVTLVRMDRSSNDDDIATCNDVLLGNNPMELTSPNDDDPSIGNGNGNDGGINDIDPSASIVGNNKGRDDIRDDDDSSFIGIPAGAVVHATLFM